MEAGADSPSSRPTNENDLIKEQERLKEEHTARMSFFCDPSNKTLTPEIRRLKNMLEVLLFRGRELVVALNLQYRTYSGKEINVVIHPYFIKQYNNRWFLFGLEQTPIGNRIANRPLDRIVKFSVSDEDFIPNTSIDFSKYFDDVVGVTIPDDSVMKETIVLKFDKERFPYVVSKPIHHSQQVLSEDDCTLQIEVRPNKELFSVIYSYFPHVEVLEPTTLRELFKEQIISNLKKYTAVQNGFTDDI